LGLRDEKSLTAAKEEIFFVVGDSFAFGGGSTRKTSFPTAFKVFSIAHCSIIAVGGADFEGYHSLGRDAEANGAAVKKLVISVTMENDLHVDDSRASQDSAPYVMQRFNLFS
jgi:hypothetical protein